MEQENEAHRRSNLHIGDHGISHRCGCAIRRQHRVHDAAAPAATAVANAATNVPATDGAASDAGTDAAAKIFAEQDAATDGAAVPGPDE